MGLFGTKQKPLLPKLDRKQALCALPVLNPLISIQHSERGDAVLNIPRRRTRMVRMIARMFRLPPYKRVELDELGTYTVELCDGSHTVADIVSRFAQHFQLNRREAEVSLTVYLQSLARRGIIAFAVPEGPREPESAGGP